MALNPLPIHLSMHPRKLLVPLFIISTVLCSLNSCGCHKPRKAGYIPAIVPKFQLTQEGKKSIEIYDEESLTLYLKETELVPRTRGKNVKFKIKKLQVTSGEIFLHISHRNQLAQDVTHYGDNLIKLEVGTEFFLSNDAGSYKHLPIIFKPLGLLRLGEQKEDTLVITLEAENNKEASVETKIRIKPSIDTVIPKILFYPTLDRLYYLAEKTLVNKTKEHALCNMQNLYLTEKTLVKRTKGPVRFKIKNLEVIGGDIFVNRRDIKNLEVTGGNIFLSHSATEQKFAGKLDPFSEEFEELIKLRVGMEFFLSTFDNLRMVFKPTVLNELKDQQEKGNIAITLEAENKQEASVETKIPIKPIEAIVPTFQLTYEGKKSIEIYDDELLTLELAETTLVQRTKGNVRFKIKNLALAEGEVFVNRKYAAQLVRETTESSEELIKLEVGTEFFLSNDAGSYKNLPLIFKPAVLIGSENEKKFNLAITLEAENKQEARVEKQLCILPNFKIYFETDLFITGGKCNYYLGEFINLNLIIESMKPTRNQEDFTIKSISCEDAKLQYLANYSLEAGDKLKPGVYRSQNPYEFEELKPPFLKYRIIQGDKDIFSPTQQHRRSNFCLTLVDSRGREYVLKHLIGLKPSPWKVGAVSLNWRYDTSMKIFLTGGRLSSDGKRDISKFLDNNFIELILDIVVKDYSEIKKGAGDHFCEIVSCRSSDQSPVTLLDKNGQHMLGRMIGPGANTLYFRLKEMRLNVNTTLTLTLKGPDGRQEEVVIEVPSKQREDFLQRRLTKIFERAANTNDKILHSLKENIKNLDLSSCLNLCRDLSKEAQAVIGEFAELMQPFMKLTDKERRELLDKVNPMLFANVESVWETLKMLEENKLQLDRAINKHS